MKKQQTYSTKTVCEYSMQEVRDILLEHFLENELDSGFDINDDQTFVHIQENKDKTLTFVVTHVGQDTVETIFEEVE